MASKICARCGRSFMGGLNDIFCSECRSRIQNSPAPLLGNKEQKKREAVRNFVRDHQGISDREVSANMNVSKKFIRSMMSAGFFEDKNSPNPKRKYICVKCGKVIESGVYCRECMTSLRDAAKVQSERREAIKRIISDERKSAKTANMILVIDKDNLSSSMIKVILENGLPSHEITVADSLVTAINTLRSSKVNLIILDDLVDADFDGLSIFENIRSYGKSRGTPVIITSATPNKDKIARALSMGALNYITKPFSPQDFVDRVSKILNVDVVAFGQKQLAQILLIDDQPKDAQREKVILESELPCEVIVSPSGVEGLYALGQKKIDLVMTNLEMPFMGGMEILSFIRKDEKTRGIPVIMMTDADEETGLGGAVRGYVKKPEFTSAGLLMIEKALKARSK